MADPSDEELREAYEALVAWGRANNAEAELRVSYNNTPCAGAKPCDLFDECSEHEKFRAALNLAEDIASAAWEAMTDLSDRLARDEGER